jgi:hypothetical protein
VGLEFRFGSDNESPGLPGTAKADQRGFAS